MRLAGRSALVTGGGMGMGRAIVLRLCAEGARVSLFDIDEAAADETCTAVAACGGHAVALIGDLADTADIANAVADHVGREGGMDILVNNAGVMHAQDDLVEATPDATWHFTFAVNLRAPYALCQAALPHMLARGRGAIVTSASNAGVMGTARPVYGASKGALIGMTLALARRHRAEGIRANVILPGAFDTPMLDRVRAFPATIAHPRFRPLDRLGRPDEIAETVAFLASDDAAAITGAIYPVDGGATAV